MAELEDYWTGDSLGDGLQGCFHSDEAVRLAIREARKRQQPVVLYDDDGKYIVFPSGKCKQLFAFHYDEEGNIEEEEEIEDDGEFDEEEAKYPNPPWVKEKG